MLSERNSEVRHTYNQKEKNVHLREIFWSLCFRSRLGHRRYNRFHTAVHGVGRIPRDLDWLPFAIRWTRARNYRRNGLRLFPV